MSAFALCGVTDGPAKICHFPHGFSAQAFPQYGLNFL